MIVHFVPFPFEVHGSRSDVSCYTEEFLHSWHARLYAINLVNVYGDVHKANIQEVAKVVCCEVFALVICSVQGRKIRLCCSHTVVNIMEGGDRLRSVSSLIYSSASNIYCLILIT